jgi:hypothetical protein
MMLVAKPIVKDKFWIVEEDDGTKVATIQTTDDGVVFVHDQYREKFPSIKILGKQYNILFDKSKAKAKKKDDTEYNVHGYTTTFKPFNELYDVSKKLPIFTKTAKSKSFYCAGYYIIQFNNGWVKSSSPKLITLNRYPFKGPFKDKFEMQEQLRLANESLRDQ